jgi:hypothetical protein
MKLNLDQYISELLFEHECVIIPGFGGIVSNYRPASLNPAQHTFSPPSKRLAFNASLRTNDGLLTAHISKKLSVNYSEATAYIKTFVDDCMKSLHDGERLILHKVGVLYFDEENNLQFMPDTSFNYLKLSFGLTALHSPSIKKDNPLHIVNEKITAKRKKKKLANWKFIEVIPVAALLTFLILNPGVVSTLNQQAASVLSLNNKVEAVSFPTHKNIPAVAEVQEKRSSIGNKTSDEAVSTEATVSVKKEEAPVINLRSGLAEETFKTESANEKTQSIESPEVKSESIPDKTSHEEVVIHTGHTYFIIGGCFRIEENAEKFLQQSLADGFEASIIGKNDKGLTMVSLFSSSSAVKIDQELQTVREKDNAQAWIFRR